jgi:hypothetical protein
VVCCYGQIRALLRSPRNRVLFGQLDVLTLLRRRESGGLGWLLGELGPPSIRSCQRHLPPSLSTTPRLRWTRGFGGPPPMRKLTFSASAAAGTFIAVCGKYDNCRI